ncbi:unnamed protein product [Brassicogethes aeneus]|uniref:Uncharacterized protein n=1 Tax=Brassicogethes aeneus TaxID=1431903 RepID=A0A9P0FD72_BRAAE|nr:unnamed protein product [Brassicogethes aeneus]
MDKDIPEEFLHNTGNYYSAPCLIGHWQERLATVESTGRNIKEKQKRGTLKIQKLRNLMTSLLQPEKLAMDTPLITFGAHYQLKNTDVPLYHDSVICHGLYASVTVDKARLGFSQDFWESCTPTAAPYNRPCVRNTITIVSSDPRYDRSGLQVVYEECICIQFTSHNGGKYYLHYDSSPMSGGSQSISLKTEIGPYSIFRIRCLEKNKEKTPIPIDSKVILVHMASNKMIAIDKSWVDTFYGPERFMSCRSGYDARRKLISDCVWTIVGHPKHDVSIIYRACLGENIPEELLDY